MKVALWVCAFACASGARFQLPTCKPSVDKCVARHNNGHDNDDGWSSNDYIVEGKRMSVATQEDVIRWTCWGSDLTSDFAPHFSSPFPAKEVELINCTIPSMSNLEDLLNILTLKTEKVTHLTISTQPQYMDVCPSMEELDSSTSMAEIVPDFLSKSLQHLSLRGVPMSTELLTSLYRIRTLTLVDTGLKKVVNLSDFSELHRLELHEPMLDDAEKLGTAPALYELVLRAPDAGLASMPLLREATFLDVYATGSIFGDCKKLEKLTIDGGYLDHIREHWLAGCTSLTYLKLTRLQYLRNLPCDLLSDTTNLRLLDLSHNSLESLPEGLFSNTEKLTSLNLRDNSLKALPSYLLPPPEDLKYACLAGNGHDLFKQVKIFPGGFYGGFYYDYCDNILIN